MPEMNASSRRRPKVLSSKNTRRYVHLSPSLDARVQALAAQERRTVTAQIEILLEHGLRAYGLEMTA